MVQGEAIFKSISQTSPYL